MLFVVDVESDGPAPGLFSMISFGAVGVTQKVGDTTFLGRTAPLPGAGRIPDAAAISGVSLEEHLRYDSPERVMKEFVDWVEKVNRDGRPVFVSDNPAFDWQFINWYLWKFVGANPFGHSARRVGDFNAGIKRDWFAPAREWKKLAKTRHDHNPLNDAKGVAEALVALGKKFKIPLPVVGVGDEGTP